jgi:hypothetical protein
MYGRATVGLRLLSVCVALFLMAGPMFSQTAAPGHPGELSGILNLDMQPGVAGSYEAVTANGLRARFVDCALALAPADSRHIPPLRMKLRSLNGAEPGFASMAARGREIHFEYERFSEWYRNTESGLMHGFTLHEAPDDSGAVELCLRVEIAAQGTLTQEGRTLEWSVGGLNVLNYGGLLAWDAAGRDLCARMEFEHGLLVLRVDTAGAVYPVNVDPVFGTPGFKLAPELDDYGIVALSGDTALVGAPHHTHDAVAHAGAVFVYTCSGGTWSLQAKLTAPSPAVMDRFGWAVALSGDTALVSAVRHPWQPNARVYVFTRSGSNWSLEATLTSSLSGDPLFGCAVALDGDTAVIGSAPPGQPGVHVFTRSGSQWSVQQVLVGNDTASGHRFGFAVDVSGDTAVVGAPGYAGAATGSTGGAAYVFVRSGSNWTQQARLMDAGTYASSLFGWSVAVDGNTVVAGDPSYDSGSTRTGIARVYVRSGSNWSLQSTLIAPAQNGGTYPLFGTSVALDGDTAVVGMPAWVESSARPNAGMAVVYVRSGTNWSRQETLQATSQTYRNHLGESVAISGDTVLAGAPGIQRKSYQGVALEHTYLSPMRGASRGVACAFTRSGSNWTLQQTLAQPDWTLAGARNGWSVSLFGAGPSEYYAVLSASPFGGHNGPGLADSGAVHPWSGRHGVTGYTTEAFMRPFTSSTDFGHLAPQAKLTSTGAQAGEWFGYSTALWRHDHTGSLEYVAMAGAPGSDTSAGTDAGAVYVLTRELLRQGTTFRFEAPPFWDHEQKLTAADGAAGDGFGWSVSIYEDRAVVGAPYATHGNQSAAGAVYVFLRSGNVWTQEAKLTASDAAAGDHFGWAVSLAGDTVVVGAPRATHGNRGAAGAAYVFTRTTTWAQQAKLVAWDAAAGDEFGTSVSATFSDIVVGAPLADHSGRTDAGAAYVYLLHGGNWQQDSKLTAGDAQNQDHFGWSVVTSSGYALIGAPRADISGQADAGAAYLFAREYGVWSENDKLSAPDPRTDSHFGWAVAMFEDTMAIGAPGHSLLMHNVNESPLNWAWALAATTSSSGYEVTEGGATYVFQLYYTPPAPAITGVTPDPVPRGEVLTITGTALSSATSVTIGGQNMTLISNTDLQIEVSVSLTHPLGPNQVIEVTTPHGSDNSARVGVIPAAPQVANVTPDPVSPGLQLSITGANLSNPLDVTIGGVSATIHSYSSTAILVTVSPSQPLGPAQIVAVTTPSGMDDSATVGVVPPPPPLPPVVNAVAPNPVRPGQLLTITGSEFDNLLAVTIGGTFATVQNSTSTQIEVVVDAAQAAGPGQAVAVTTANGMDAGTTVDVLPHAPIVTGVAPNPVRRGDSLTIDGQNLDAAVSVNIGGQAVALQSNTDTRIVATIAANHSIGAAQVVEVTTAGGVHAGLQVDVLPPPPVVTQILPDQVQPGGQLHIHGSNLDVAPQVTIAGLMAVILSSAPDQLVVSVHPAQPAGADQVVSVSTPGGADNTGRVEVLPPPPSLPARPTPGGCAARTASAVNAWSGLLILLALGTTRLARRRRAACMD